MSLVIDARPQTQGERGLHAFIVGVSAYPYLPQEGQPDVPGACGLKQLSSSALTALKMARWLIDRSQRLAAPLVTCRLLLTPQPGEGDDEPELKKAAGDATFASFSAAAKAWRDDAASRQDNITFFYFAGHGIKRERRDHVLILQNFGDGIGGTLSTKAVNINDLMDGMAPAKSQPEIARTQLYVFDACRTTPEAFEDKQIMQVGAIWDVATERMTDDRMRPQLFSAIPGSAAYAGKDGTLFGTALLDSLKGGAGVLLNDDDDEDAAWGISLYALPKALAYHLDKINKAKGADQNWEINSLWREMIIQRLDAPPSVDVMLRLNPPDDAASARVSVRDEADTYFRRDIALDPHPFPDAIPAGRYVVEANVQPPGAAARGKRGFDASPPFTDCLVRLKP